MAIYQLSALAVVMFSLTALWVLCEITAAVFRRLPRQAQSRHTPPAASCDIRGATGDAVAPELAAVIAAAVTATLGGDFEVVGIRRKVQAPGSVPQLAAWTIQGRLQHHTSHAVR